MKRTVNFNAGPAALPLPALERARVEFLDFESHPDEPGVQLFRGHLPVGSCPLQDLGQPGLRYSHVCSALSFVDKSL